MTNPNNAVGTNGAFGGRTSVNAFNDIMGAFQSRGVLSGWGISPSSGMTVSVGGNGTTRDVAVAEDASGNKTSVNNISGAPILVTLDSAPASNSRYDAIVAYVDKPPVSSATQDNPECCGIIPVTGTAASTPSYPSDATIRSAITADGASGATAYYAILGYVLVASGTTSITSGMITGAGNPVINAALGPNSVGTAQIQTGAVTSDKIDSTTLFSGSADNTDVQLSDDCRNYKYIEIYAQEAGSRKIYSKFIPSSGAIVVISAFVIGVSNNNRLSFCRSATYQVSNNGRTLELLYKGMVGITNINNVETVTVDTVSGAMVVTKVIGYK